MHVTFSIAGTTFLVFCVFAIAAAGYLLGRVTIQGVSLGTAGVFVAALLFGCFCYGSLSEQLTVAGATFVTDGLKIVENLGLMFFVTAVGFIAGPGFVHNFKQNFKSYVCLGLVITLFGGVACVLCILIGRSFTGLSHAEFTAILVGLLAGALTSTPAFSAAKATVATAELESLVSVGYGIAYLFGVVGVVLFVQLIPKLTHADLDRERDRLTQVSQNAARRTGRVCLDEFGLMPLALAIVCGIVVGSCKVGNFSLTTTGGCLLAGLISWDETVKLTEKWFAPIPRRDVPVRQLPQEPEQTQERRLTVERNVPLDALFMGYHMCSRESADYYAFDILSDILSNGRSSRLNRRLVQEQNIFSGIDAYISGTRDAGLLQISGKPAAGVSLEQAEAAVRKELEELQRSPVDGQELEKVKNKFEST